MTNHLPAGSLPVTACLACGFLLLLAAHTRAADPTTRPGVEQLPSIKELPDPFVFNDGSRVKTKQDWERRRGELRELIFAYEYGHMPPAPGNVKATETPDYTPPKGDASIQGKDPNLASQPLPQGTTEKKYKLTMGPEQKVSTHVLLTIPPGKGPFPVIIRGDLNWGRLKPDIIIEAISRGYMVAEFDRTQIVPDSKDYTAGAYPVYPEYDMRALCAWAWGYHRVIDYLVTRDDVDAKHIAVTGHSRGGKATLLAGATDERIALTAPNNSGCGGAGCYRFQAPNSETLPKITDAFPFWFQAHIREFIGRIDRLPIDQHSVKALVAPRALLSTEALGDQWANPEGSQHTYLAAREVYDFLGAADRIGIVYREGGHQHGLVDWQVLLDYADQVFFNKPSTRKFDKLAFPDSPKSFNWTAPGKASATAP